MGVAMRRNGNRTITVNKSDLIEKIKANKTRHEKAYVKAVVAYKKEALKQLVEQTKKVRAGNMQATLHLVTPINNSDNYDKLIDMFNWEVNDQVELEQNEFNEYVQDETSFAREALYSNTMYLNAGH